MVVLTADDDVMLVLVTVVLTADDDVMLVAVTVVHTANDDVMLVVVTVVLTADDDVMLIAVVVVFVGVAHGANSSRIILIAHCVSGQLSSPCVCAASEDKRQRTVGRQ